MPPQDMMSFNNQCCFSNKAVGDFCLYHFGTENLYAVLIQINTLLLINAACLFIENKFSGPDKKGKKDDLGIIFLYHSFKTYVATQHVNQLAETVLMRGHNICFR